jgi:hypothetical protein
MTALADFLLARIAEDEALARQVITDIDADEQGRWEWVEYPYEGGSPQRLGSLAESKSGYDPGWGWTELVNHYDPARVLAECEAKRRIVERYLDTKAEAERHDNEYAAEWLGLETALEILTLPYADHPDYREDWRP